MAGACQCVVHWCRVNALHCWYGSVEGQLPTGRPGLWGCSISQVLSGSSPGLRPASACPNKPQPEPKMAAGALLSQASSLSTPLHSQVRHPWYLELCDPGQAASAVYSQVLTSERAQWFLPLDRGEARVLQSPLKRPVPRKKPTLTAPVCPWLCDNTES